MFNVSSLIKENHVKWKDDDTRKKNTKNDFYSNNLDMSLNTIKNIKNCNYKKLKYESSKTLTEKYKENNIEKRQLIYTYDFNLNINHLNSINEKIKSERFKENNQNINEIQIEKIPQMNNEISIDLNVSEDYNKIDNVMSNNKLDMDLDNLDSFSNYFSEKLNKRTNLKNTSFEDTGDLRIINNENNYLITLEKELDKFELDYYNDTNNQKNQDLIKNQYNKEMDYKKYINKSNRFRNNGTFNNKEEKKLTNITYDNQFKNISKSYNKNLISDNLNKENERELNNRKKYNSIQNVCKFTIRDNTPLVNEISYKNDYFNEPKKKNNNQEHIKNFSDENYIEKDIAAKISDENIDNRFYNKSKKNKIDYSIEKLNNFALPDNNKLLFEINSNETQDKNILKNINFCQYNNTHNKYSFKRRPKKIDNFKLKNKNEQNTIDEQQLLIQSNSIDNNSEIINNINLDLIYKKNKDIISRPNNDLFYRENRIFDIDGIPIVNNSNIIKTNKLTPDFLGVVNNFNKEENYMNKQVQYNFDNSLIEHKKLILQNEIDFKNFKNNIERNQKFNENNFTQRQNIENLRDESFETNFIEKDNFKQNIYLNGNKDDINNILLKKNLYKKLKILMNDQIRFKTELKNLKDELKIKNMDIHYFKRLIFEKNMENEITKKTVIRYREDLKNILNVVYKKDINDTYINNRKTYKDGVSFNKNNLFYSNSNNSKYFNSSSNKKSKSNFLKTVNFSQRTSPVKYQTLFQRSDFKK